MAAIYYKDQDGNFTEFPMSSVTPEQIQEAVKTYLAENPLESIQEIEEEEIDSISTGGIYKIPHYLKTLNGSIVGARYELLFVSLTSPDDGIQMRITAEGILYRRLNVNMDMLPWGSEWNEYGGSVDLSNYYTKTEVDNLIIDVNAKVEEAEAVAKGRATGYVFDTVSDMNHWLEDSVNTAKLVLGDNLYIRATDVPDYWWDGVQARPLETQKVDLTEYAKQGTTLSEYSITDAYTKTEVDNRINSAIGEALEGDY